MKLQIHELGSLFEDVQKQNVLGDGKTFPDCTPKRPLEEINSDYAKEKGTPDFDLQEFVVRNFDLPKVYTTDYKSDLGQSAEQHIDALWNHLIRKPDTEARSLIALPHPYVVPGGRFREIYYWDSYFTMLGLRASGRLDLIQNMVDNFAFLIENVGYIPNGNRTYFLGRSQPPFFSPMINLLDEEKMASGESREPVGTITKKYLHALEREYQFWMHGSETLTENRIAQHRVVRMPDGSILNRYWDENDTPRPEAFKEDVELSFKSAQKPEELFRHLRAAAESGWDFSSRWFREEKDFSTIHTTEIIPVDLNCLLWNLENHLAKAHQLSGNVVKLKEYNDLAEHRKSAIDRYCWNQEKGFYFDYDFVLQRQKGQLTLAASYPLFFELASQDQAVSVAEMLERDFLKTGGMTTTLVNSGQQWDAPNGWAPLQWITYTGFLRYGFNDLATRLKSNWINANLKVYRNTGKMTEKYDVWNQHGEASGGEYPNQDGFGWTNGVFLAMR